MSLMNSVKTLRSDLKSAGYRSTILATLGDTVLIGIDGTTVDVAAHEDDTDLFSCKVGHNDKFVDVHPLDVVDTVSEILGE